MVPYNAYPVGTLPAGPRGVGDAFIRPTGDMDKYEFWNRFGNQEVLRIDVTYEDHISLYCRIPHYMALRSPLSRSPDAHSHTSPSMTHY